jgi:hypothetical protein
VALYLVKRCCDRTLPQIAQYFGKTLDVPSMTKLLDALDALSEEEAKRLVGEQRNENSAK